MKSKTYVLAIVLMFFLTLSCAYASDNQTADNVLLSSPVDDVSLSSPVNDVSLSSPVNDDLLGSAPSLSEISYEDLVIKDINFTGDRTNLNIEGFTQNGLSMSDFTMSIVPASDSSNLDLKMNIPEVTYTNFENTMFKFKNLDLSILPSSNPSSLEFSAIMDSLILITGRNYVNLTDLNLFFKSYPETNGVRLNIDIGDFVYNNFNGTTFDFTNIKYRMGIGLDGQKLAISVVLPTLNLINENNIVNLKDLDLNILLPSLKLGDLDLSILMSDFHYANPNGSIIDMTNVNVSLEPILNSTSFNSIIRMDTFDVSGVNSTGELFPLLNISNLNFENFTTGLDLSSVDLTGIISTLDISKMDLSDLVRYLSSGFNITTYTSNMPDQYKSSLDFNAIDLSSTGLANMNFSGFDLGNFIKGMDFSSIEDSTFNLTGIFNAFGINISDFGIDMSGYNISAINMSSITDILNNPDFNISAITSKLNLSDLNLGGLNISGLIKNLNLSSFNLTDILGMFNMSGFNLTEFFKNFDLNKLLNLFMNKYVPDNTTPNTNPDYPSYNPVKYVTYNNAASKTYTVLRASDNILICKSKLFILEYLNKLFNMTFINGHLKVYIDGELVFEGDTTDDLTQVIFEIVDKYLGEHEITVEFTDREGKSNTYKEKIIVG